MQVFQVLTTVFFILFMGCENLFAELPDWVQSSDKACKKSELCAVGEGDSQSVAARNARLAISKIFETQVLAKFSSELGNNNGQTNDSAKEVIEESTSSALEGVEIAKTAESKTSFYSLAVIKKDVAAKGFEREIKKIDEKLTALASENDSTLHNKIESLFYQRESLNKSYSFLTGQSIQSPVDFASMFKNKRQAQQGIIIHVFIDELEPKLIENVLVTESTSMGYKVTTGQIRKKESTHILTGSLIEEKQYMNVDGFEKYLFSLKLSSATSARTQLAGLNFEATETGRNFQQATDKALPKIIQHIKENITTLKF